MGAGQYEEVELERFFLELVVEWTDGIARLLLPKMMRMILVTMVMMMLMMMIMMMMKKSLER